MFVVKDFVRDCFSAQIRAKICMRAGSRAYLREEATPSKILGYEYSTNIGTIPKNILTDFQLKRLKLKLDIV